MIVPDPHLERVLNEDHFAINTSIPDRHFANSRNSIPEPLFLNVPHCLLASLFLNSNLTLYTYHFPNIKSSTGNTLKSSTKRNTNFKGRLMRFVATISRVYYSTKRSTELVNKTNVKHKVRFNKH